MNEIVKICSKHGQLKIDQVHKENNSKLKKGYMFRCNQCKLDKDRRWKELNREKHNAVAGQARKEARRLYREGLINTEPKANIWNKEDRKKDPLKHKKWSFDYRKKHGINKVIRDIVGYFGITLQDYEKLFDQQNHVCAICGNAEIRKSRTEGQICRLGVDHCHSCEEKGIRGMDNVRGLLCHACNTGIGKFKDDVKLMEKAIAYLKKHQCN